jgi:Tat protein translocase TatB subunit
MFGIGMTELMVILVLGLLILGPKRLPDLARSLGRGRAEFRRASTDLRREFLDVADGARIDLPQEEAPPPDEAAPSDASEGSSAASPPPEKTGG